MIKEFIDKIKEKYFTEGSFKGDFVTLSLGRTLSQIIPLLVTPILTRMYTPEDFGVYAIFLSIVTVIALLSNGRYNLAITLPKEPKKATDLLTICFIGILSASLFTFLLIISFKSYFSGLLSLEGKEISLLFVPLGVLIVAGIESFYYWLLRKRFYKFLSKNFIIQTFVTTLFKLLFAFLNFGWLGLILGYILGALLTLILFTFRFLKETDFKALLKDLEKQRLLKVAKRYKKFPTLSLPADGINSFANQLPTILLNSFFGPTITGFYSLTNRVLGLPIAFVSSAMGDVYREKASADNRDKGSSRKVFLVTLKYLLIFSIIPFLLLFIFAPSLVPFILGDQWQEAGTYIRILTPLFLFRFIASPLGSTLYITGKQKHFLLWQIGLLICTIGSFYIGNMVGNEYTSLIIFSASYSFMYILLLVLAYKFSISSTDEREAIEDK